MRKILHLLFIAFLFPFTSHAQQFTLTPQLGIQSSHTKVLFNNSPYASPYRTFAPYLGARLVYQSKKGHGPYLNLALGTSANTFKLSDHNTPFLTSFTLAQTNMIRIEGGYQWNSKPLYFKRVWDNNMSAEEFAKLKKKGWYVRFQPFAGLGFEKRNGGTGYDFYHVSQGTVSTYSSRSNFVLSTGLNMEFGKNDKPKFTLSINYIAGLRGGQTTIIDRTINGTNYQTHLFNRSSGFNVTLGVPLTLWKKKRR